MARYTAAVTTPAAAAGAAFATFHTVATDRPRIVEIGAFCNAATAASLQLIRPNNTPVASTSVVGQPEDPSDPAATCLVDTAWSTAPTIGSNVPLRRAVMPATIGAGVIWVFQNGLFVPISSWLVLWNYGASAGPALSVYMIWDE